MIHQLYEKLKNPPNLPANMQKDFERFVKKIGNFWYFEEKHFEKVKIFAENNDLLEYLLFLAEDLEPLYETNKDFNFLVLVFAFSENENAIKYLQNLTEKFIEKQVRVDLLLQIFSFVKNPKLQNSLQNLEKYFEKLYENSPYFSFVEEVWLDFSGLHFQKTGGEWYFSFALTTIAGKEYQFQCDSEDEKQNFYKISVDFFTPRDTEKCFKIHLSEPFYKISFFDWDKDYVGSEKAYVELYLKDSWQNFIIENWEKFSHLPKTIKKIEEILWVKFSLEKIYFSFSKGMKGKKNLEKWILENLK